MRVISILLVFATLCYRCNDTEAADASGVTGCYTDTRTTDRIAADFRVSDNAVTGTLTYDFAEKDDNTGTFTGMLQGDTLRGVYTFESEGQRSKREVAFLQRGETLVEGYGNVSPAGDVQRFSNVAEITYGQGIVLTKTACE